ncbi:hypothetical protein PTTG_26125 [Puccinia triticina 1-1 BBBD Race 1]|uniref:Uncharacterized protein n=1 Tax=Puccinia triticina (isolate 1-1 / race 1 (BBBD)) TaxID=630390 RepID=A0A180GWZ3_PUCT1|nr:hypothetical protein PTTG_26125 [Puccinia triticina 1-1 BBBD Race 1]
MGHRQARIAKKDEFDNILDFFEAPTSKPTDKSTEPINYKCKWCKGNYQAHETTKGNLWAHRDGSTQAGKNAKGCINRNLAKKLGAKLPPSVAEKKLVDSQLKPGEAKQSGIAGFLEVKPTFVNRVLNQMLMIWQVRQALPWSRLQDPHLRATFLYTNLKAVLYG